MNLLDALNIVRNNPEELLLKPSHWGDEAFVLEEGKLKYIPTSHGGHNWMTYQVSVLLGEWSVVDWNFKEVSV